MRKQNRHCALLATHVNGTRCVHVATPLPCNPYPAPWPVTTSPQSCRRPHHGRRLHARRLAAQHRECRSHQHRRTSTRWKPGRHGGRQAPRKYYQRCHRRPADDWMARARGRAVQPVQYWRAEHYRAAARRRARSGDTGWAAKRASAHCRRGQSRGD